MRIAANIRSFFSNSIAGDAKGRPAPRTASPQPALHDETEGQQPESRDAMYQRSERTPQDARMAGTEKGIIQYC